VGTITSSPPSVPSALMISATWWDRRTPTRWGLIVIRLIVSRARGPPSSSPELEQDIDAGPSAGSPPGLKRCIALVAYILPFSAPLSQGCSGPGAAWSPPKHHRP
jgi:hypothetical protein